MISCLSSRFVENMRGFVYSLWGVALLRPVVALNPRSKALSTSGFGAGRSRRPQDKLKFIVTLERATGGKNVGRDEDLWSSGVFDAEVHPDLPPARKTAELITYYAQRAKEGVLGARPSAEGDSAAATLSSQRTSSGSGRRRVRDGEGYLVRSVPVQTSSREALRRRLAAAAGVDSDGAVLPDARPADALLLLSGNHPGRRLPFMRHFLPDVYDELRLATRMRDSGLLPEGLAFWAVANPLTEAGEAGVDRLRRKVQLGAEVILTQPPLAWQPFERWLRGVHLSGALRGSAHGEMNQVRKAAALSHALLADEQPNELAGGATLLIGMPVITSPEGLRFWLQLCGVEHDRSICKEAFQAFGNPKLGAETAQAENKAVVSAASPSPGNSVDEKAVDETNVRRSPRGFGLLIGSPRGTKGATTAQADEATEVLPYGQAWFETTMSYLRCLDGAGVAGVHVMAPAPGPRRMAKSLVDGGIFEQRLK